jgi:hypothetical protein
MAKVHRDHFAGVHVGLFTRKETEVSTSKEISLVIVKRSEVRKTILLKSWMLVSRARGLLSRVRASMTEKVRIGHFLKVKVH